MSRKEQFFTLIKNEQSQLRNLGVLEIGLFGSTVRCDDNSGSDYDVLVVFEKSKKNFKNFITLVDFLETELDNKVELVTKESLSPHIGPHILKEVEYVPIAS